MSTGTGGSDGGMTVASLQNDITILRHLLFMQHGNDEHYLYGDDGERRCNTCMIDFNNDTPDQIQQKIYHYNMRKLQKEITAASKVGGDNEMNDIEMVKACAEAVGIELRRDSAQSYKFIGGKWYEHNFDPIHDDAQALALVKRLHLDIEQYQNSNGTWYYVAQTHGTEYHACADDLNRAIVECVAKLHAAQTEVK
jgi:phage tail sheath gpL-like